MKYLFLLLLFAYTNPSYAQDEFLQEDKGETFTGTYKNLSVSGECSLWHTIFRDAVALDRWVDATVKLKFTPPRTFTASIYLGDSLIATKTIKCRRGGRMLAVHKRSTSEWMVAPIIWGLNSYHCRLIVNEKNQLSYSEVNGGLMFLVFFPMMGVNTGYNCKFERIADN